MKRSKRTQIDSSNTESKRQGPRGLRWKAALTIGVLSLTALGGLSKAIANDSWKMPWTSSVTATMTRGALSDHRDGYIGNGRSVDFALPPGYASISTC